MGLKDKQTRYLALVEENEQIATKAETTKDDYAKLEANVKEGESLIAEIELMLKAEGQKSWGQQQSGGMLKMADATKNAATVHGMRHDGDVVVEDKGDSVLVAADGTPLIEERKLKAIKSADYRRAMNAYVRSGGDQHIMAMRSGMESIKVLQEGLDVSGGFLVPEDIQNRVVQKEPTPTILAGRVTRLTTSRDQMVFPKVTYTTDNSYTTPMRVTWTGEVPASASVHNVTDPTFGQERIPIYTAMMSIPVTNDMIEDSAFDIMGWIGQKFNETIDLLYENMILNGSGAAQPQGILNNSTAQTNYIASGGASTLTGDGIVDVAFQLPPQYDNNAVFVMNKTSTARAIFKLKDGEGRYLWANQAEGGGLMVPKVRSDLLGYPVLYTEFMPNVAANSYSIIFGDLRGYFLVQRIGFSITVARELKIETNQVLVVGRIRFGGQLVEDWRLKLQKTAAS